MQSKTVPLAKHIRSSADPRLLSLSDETLRLFEILLRERPENVLELSTRVGRETASVSRSLGKLRDHGFVRLVREGQSVRPEMLASAVRIDFATRKIEIIPLEPAPQAKAKPGAAPEAAATPKPPKAKRQKRPAAVAEARVA